MRATRAVFATAATFLLMSGAGPLEAQGRGSGAAGVRRTLDRTEEISLARSAAPASVSEAATVFVFEDGRYRAVHQGAGPAACMVDRSWPDAIEPVCFDGEGAASIMRILMRRTELLHLGNAPAAADRLIDEAVAAGQLRYPAGMAIGYMMSAAQQLIGDDGRSAGRWKPHLMIYRAGLTNAALGHATPPAGTAAGFVVDEGEAGASLIVVVPDFVPAPGPPPRP